MILGKYKSDKDINFIGIDKVHLKYDCINSSIVNGIREPILYNFGLTSPRGHKIYKQLGIKQFKRTNESVLSQILFYLEDDYHKPVGFDNEILSFTCQLNKR